MITENYNRMKIQEEEMSELYKYYKYESPFYNMNYLGENIAKVKYYDPRIYFITEYADYLQVGTYMYQDIDKLNRKEEIYYEVIYMNYGRTNAK